MALAEALSKSTPACLGSLVLDNVGMGDEGIAALASLVGQGRMEQLTELDISQNAALTQQGIITLARRCARAAHAGGICYGGVLDYDGSRNQRRCTRSLSSLLKIQERARARTLAFLIR